MSKHDDNHTRAATVRRDVSDAYARAICGPTASGSCCQPRGAAASYAGYSDEQLAALPAEAVQNAFGCGNPLAHSELRPGEVVLDLGSGAGIDILLAAAKVGSTGRVIGVDMTDEMLDLARRNIAAARADNIEVRRGLIEDLPVDSGSVDWVLSNCVINLSPEKPRVFAEIARVLRAGGRMLVSDIVAEDLPAWVRVSAHLYSSCIAGAISEASYLQGLRDAGLVDVEVRDRLVYDEQQLARLAVSELDGSVVGCCGGASGEPSSETMALVRRAAADLAGKVASVKVYGRRP